MLSNMHVLTVQSAYKQNYLVSYVSLTSSEPQRTKFAQLNIYNTSQTYISQTQRNKLFMQPYNGYFDIFHGLNFI